KIFRLLFFLVHLLFPKSFFGVGHPKLIRQRLFAHTANFKFATVNRRMTIRTAKFHKTKFSSAASNCSVNFPARASARARARPPRRARAAWANSKAAGPFWRRRIFVLRRSRQSPVSPCAG